MSRHRHTFDSIALVDRALHLRCGGCGHVDPEPTTAHEWRRPGRPLAHGRHVECRCCSIAIVLPWTVTYSCARHGSSEHLVRVRPRGGLGVVCRRCHTKDSARRAVPVLVSRAASRRYQARLRAARKAMLPW